MAIEPGSKLGPYEIGEIIGVGGMGEVFLATDTRLKRQVAVKVLPESFANDEDRLARFQREAEILASLNHPNIAQIYGLEQEQDTTALIMELVEGPTLADRIAEGPLLPDDALSVAHQVIDALEAAHDQHIVHRDLKPANIKLRDDGTVKVLDFGIAKPLDTRSISGGPPASLNTPAMTETGLIMGTAAYMSPEQARGRSVDQRTDVWAFGCVLFEMLTGQPAFQGEDVTVTLARVIERDTDLGSVPGSISPAVRHALKLCLVKDPRHRIADIRDVRLALDGELESLSGHAAEARSAAPAWRVTVPASIVAAAVAGLAVWLVMPTDQPGSAASPQVIRYTLPLNVPPDDDDDDARELFLGGSDSAWGWPALNALAFSNDGTRLAYAVWTMDENNAPKGEILLQRLDQRRAVAVAGTAMAFEPFFSPDDRWLGFFQGGALKRVSLVNGTVETLVADPDNFRAGIWGAQWLEDGTIIYGGFNGLYRIRENGAELEQLLALDRTQGEFLGYVMPQLLPDGRTLLFHTVKTTLRPADAEIRALDLESGRQSVLLTDAQDPWYLPSTGHLMFIRQGTLMAVLFDPASLTLEGEPIIVLEDVVQAQGMPNLNFESGVAQIAYSSAGHLAYVAGGTYPKPTSQLARVTVDRIVEPIVTDEHNYLSLRLSPDGNRVAFADFYGIESDIYIHDLDRDVTRRVNTGSSVSNWPLWSPDGQSLIYSATADNDSSAVYRISTTGSGEPQRLAPVDNVHRTASSVSPTGAIAILQSEPGAASGIWVIPTEGQPEPFFTPEKGAAWPTFSPDGNWILYGTNEANRQEVFVRPYPAGEPATQISGNGGGEPAWSTDGRTIIFMQDIDEEGQPARKALMQASFTPGDPPIIGRVEPYIDWWPFEGSIPVRSYELLDDGSIITPASAEEIAAFTAETRARTPRELNGLQEVRVVLNFTEEMRQRTGQE